MSNFGNITNYGPSQQGDNNVQNIQGGVQYSITNNYCREINEGLTEIINELKKNPQINKEDLSSLETKKTEIVKLLDNEKKTEEDTKSLVAKTSEFADDFLKVTKNIEGVTETGKKLYGIFEKIGGILIPGAIAIAKSYGLF